MSLFDLDSIMSERQEAKFETKFTQVEPGEYPAIITKYQTRTLPKHDDPSQESSILDITFRIDDARQREVTGLAEPTVRQSIFLDLTPEGKLDRSKNKNIGLGRLLEALGLNEREWSAPDLVGRACLVKIEQTPNKKSPADPFVNVTKVGKLTS